MNARKKLWSRRGASALLALLVFLLALLSGTAALTMAASNAGRETHERDDQQAYLAVASAAKLILGELENVEVWTVFKTSNPTVIGGANSDYQETRIMHKGAHGAGSSVSKDRVTDSLLNFFPSEFGLNLARIQLGKETTAIVDVPMTLRLGEETGAVSVTMQMDNTRYLIFHLYYRGRASSNYCVRMTVEADHMGKIEPNEAVFGTGSSQNYAAFWWDAENATFEAEDDNIVGGQPDEGTGA